jgi:hypothetical protein
VRRKKIGGFVSSFIFCGIASVGGLNGQFHEGDLFIRQVIEAAFAFPC